MRPWQTVPVIAAAVLAAACATAAPAVVPLEGSPTDMLQLAGRWLGEYSSSAPDREGTLVFELQAGERAAQGHVWMTRRPQGAALPGLDSPATIARPLAIRFVAVEGNLISGTLDPYLDPVTSCTLLTTFQGALDGDVISGSFVTENQNTGEKVGGSWSAKRVRRSLVATR